MDPVTSARGAREGLARGLALLQAPGLPPSLLSIVEQVAQAMSLLHRIEVTHGAAFSDAAPTALGLTRRALADLQGLSLPNPEVERALEAIAGSLGTIHQLALAATAAPVPQASTQVSPSAPRAPAAPVQPSGVSPYAGTMLHAMPSAEPPAAPQAPARGPHGTQPSPAYPQSAPVPAGWQQPQPPAGWQQPQPPAPPAGWQQPQAQPPAPPAGWQQPQPPAPPASWQQPQPPAPATAGWQQPQPPAPPAPAGWQQPQPPAAAPRPPAAGAPPQAPAPGWDRPPASVLQPPPANVGPGAPVRIEAALGAHSPTNFYKSLAGNDVIEAGGLFVATYQIPPLGTQVMLRVALPGGYEFEAIAVVRWARETRDAESEAPPGFGAQFVQITPEARQLVYRYVRNREPLFHDEN